MDYYVSLSYATFMITIEDDVCTKAAPIAKWMVGKSSGEISNWVVKKQGTVTKLG